MSIQPTYRFKRPLHKIPVNGWRCEFDGYMYERETEDSLIAVIQGKLVEDGIPVKEALVAAQNMVEDFICRDSFNMPCRARMEDICPTTPTE